MLRLSYQRRSIFIPCYVPKGTLLRVGIYPRYFISYQHSIGICYEGGLDAQGRACDTRTPAPKRALLELLTDLHRRYPMALILGHRDLSPDLNGNGLIEPNEYLKQCPCFDVMKEYG